MNVCGTKPPPKLSSAKSADSRSTIPRERWSGGSGSAWSSSPRSTAAESPAAATRAVAAAPPDPVAVAGDQHRDAGGAGQQGCQDGADRGVREAAAGERDPDQHRAEPVRDRACRLGGDDPARVGAQPRSSYTAAPPLPGQKAYRQRSTGSQPLVCAPGSVSIVSSGSSRSLSKLHPTPRPPIATYRRRRSASCMTT